MRLAVLLSILVSTSCGRAVDGEATSPQSESSITGPRQTDSEGAPLPFDTQFYKRWNAGNDGTAYEPCTAAEPELVRALGLDPESVYDAALVDGQTARGCTWKALPPLRGGLRLSQTVGNSESLATYKRKNSAHAVWLPDLEVEGRQVGVEHDVVGGCTVYVQSGYAGVVTGVTSTSPDRVTIDQQCEKAIAFTKATIGKMPP